MEANYLSNSNTITSYFRHRRRHYSPPSLSSSPPFSSMEEQSQPEIEIQEPQTKAKTSLKPKITPRPRKIQKLATSDEKSPPQEASNDTESIPAAKLTRKKLRPHRYVPAVNIPAKSLSCDGEIQVAINYLRSLDPCLAPLIDFHKPPNFDKFHTPFIALIKSILYQQLAYKAGASIFTRFVLLCGGEAGVLPETVIALNPNDLRQIGVSARKTSYLHDLSKKYINGILSDSLIVTLDDKSLFTMLTMVNGIGSWSVHMFMIFSLHRPDVLPVHDLGVRKGVQLLYNLDELPKPSQMEQLCEKWRPYRSVASWYMWRFVDTNGPSSSSVLAGAMYGSSLHQQEQLEQQNQQQQQFLDPVSGILNIGAWGQ